MESLFQVFFNGFNGYPCDTKDLGKVFSELLKLLYSAQEANTDSSLIKPISFSYYPIGCFVQINQ
jgi:hypothetical protein